MLFTSTCVQTDVWHAVCGLGLCASCVPELYFTCQLHCTVMQFLDGWGLERQHYHQGNETHKTLVHHAYVCCTLVHTTLAAAGVQNMYIIFTVTLHCCVSEPFSRHWFCWLQCKAPPRVILGRSSCSLGCCILACEWILVAVLCEYIRHHKWMGVEWVGQSARSAWIRRTVGSFTRTVCYNNHLSYNCDIRETRVIITITGIMQSCIST